jgi:sarcosine oxidase subunit gamma
VSAPEPQSPIGQARRPGRHGATDVTPVSLGERQLDICQVMARKGRADAVKGAIAKAFAMDLPEPGRAASGSGARAIWIAPDTWLMLRQRAAGGDLMKELAEACGGAASLVDQTFGKVTLRISGLRATDVLSKGCRVDLHPREFGPGHVALTPVAHIHAVLLQVDATPSFDLIVPSTLARDVFEWLCLSAAEYGYEVTA